MHAIGKDKFSDNLKYHLDNDISLDNCIFRIGSDAWCDLICEARTWYDHGYLDDLTEEEYLMLESDAGERAMYEGKIVVLDCPEPTWAFPGECTVYSRDENGQVTKVIFVTDCIDGYNNDVY